MTLSHLHFAKLKKLNGYRGKYHSPYEQTIDHGGLTYILAVGKQIDIHKSGPLGATLYCLDLMGRLVTVAEKVRKLSGTDIVDRFALEALAKDLLRGLSMPSNELEIVTS